MKPTIVILICICATILSIFTIIFLYNPSLVELVEFPSSLKIDTVGALNTDTHVLSFGKIAPLMESAKVFELQNTHPFPVNFVVQLTAPYSSWVRFNMTEGSLKPGQNISIEAIATAPFHAPLGNYTGNLSIYLYQQRYKVFLSSIVK